MTVRRWIIWSVVAIVLGLGFYWLSTWPRTLVADLPELPMPSSLAPLPTVSSVVNVPVSLPLVVLSDELRHQMPNKITVPRRQKSFTIKVPLTRGVRFCLFVDRMQYLLTDPTLARSGQRLRVQVSGTADRLRFRVRSGGCSRAPGGFSFNLRHVWFNAEVTFGLHVANDWALKLSDRRISFDLKRVIVQLPFFGSVNIAAYLQGEVQGFAESMVNALLTRVAQSVDAHVLAARTVWTRMCRTLELDADSGLYLQVKPTDAYVEKPRLANGEMTVNVGLRLRTTASLRTAGGPQPPRCPFPARVGNRIPASQAFGWRCRRIWHTRLLTMCLPRCWRAWSWAVSVPCPSSCSTLA